MGISVPPLPRVLILDYHDSYTNNLLTLFVQLYSDKEVQDKVVVVYADSLTWLECQDLLMDVDCILLSPGPGRPDNPSDIGFALDLLRTTTLPVLGICLGLQALAVAYGGRIIPTPQIQHGQVIPVTHSRKGVFDQLPGEGEGVVDVVVYNSLTVDPASVPEELEIVAWTSKDEKLSTIQALSHRTKPQWGVQFHPESISSTSGLAILLSFLHHTTTHHSQPPSYPPLSERILRLSSTFHSAPARVLEQDGGRKGRVLRLVEESLGEGVGVAEVFERGFVGRCGLGEVWLDGESPNIKTTSTLAIPKFILTYSIPTRTITCHHLSLTHSLPTTSSITIPASQTFWDWFSHGQTHLQSLLAPSPTSTGRASRWAGGWAGFWGYEMKESSLPGYELPEETRGKMKGVDACWAWCDWVLEKGEGGWVGKGVIADGELGVESEGGEVGEGMMEWLQRLGITFGASERDFRSWTTHIRTHLSPSPTFPLTAASPMPTFHPINPPETYKSGIQSCRSQIHSGNSYELTLTTTFTSPVSPRSPLSLYLHLRANNPSPYSAYFNLPTVGVSILSSSPERFLRIGREGAVEMKPIKGTRRRVRCLCGMEGKACLGPGGEGCREWCEVEDKRVGQSLQDDKKERAENLMIVDLIRSDLLSVCTPSSVKVPKLIQLETYQTVHQLVTTVVGQLEEGVGAVEGVRRCFPPGSMTGAPKLRSVQILDELEYHRPRGIYSGALGYMGIDGATDLSVVIRTIVIQDGEMTIGAGGAITWLSDVEAEWEEVLTKMNSVTQ